MELGRRHFLKAAAGAAAGLVAFSTFWAIAVSGCSDEMVSAAHRLKPARSQSIPRMKALLV